MWEPSYTECNVTPKYGGTSTWVFDYLQMARWLSTRSRKLWRRKKPSNGRCPRWPIIMSRLGNVALLSLVGTLGSLHDVSLRVDVGPNGRVLIHLKDRHDDGGNLGWLEPQRAYATAENPGSDL